MIFASLLKWKCPYINKCLDTLRLLLAFDCIDVVAFESRSPSSRKMVHWAPWGLEVPKLFEQTQIHARSKNFNKPCCNFLSRPDEVHINWKWNFCYFWPGKLLLPEFDRDRMLSWCEDKNNDYGGRPSNVDAGSCRRATALTSFSLCQTNCRCSIDVIVKGKEPVVWGRWQLLR